MSGQRDWRKEPGGLGEAGKYLGHGLTWALSTLLFLYLGWRVDGWAGTVPLFTILGAFVGAAAGFYNLYHHLVVKPRERDRRERGKDG